MRRTIFEPEHEQFRDSVRKFMQAEVEPHRDRWREAGMVDREIFTKAGAQGLLCVFGDEEFGGAGIDVLEQEPPTPESPVLRAWRDPEHPAHDRLILNPHSAFYCEEGGEEFRTKAAREVLRMLRGEPLRNVVN